MTAKLSSTSTYAVTMFTLTSVILLSMASELVLGCFPVQTTFMHSTIWSQDLRNPWRRLYVIGQESDDLMSVETQQPEMITKAWVTCLQKVTDHRFLVKVEEDGGLKGFQCLEFTPLSRQVVRRGHTKLQKDRIKVDCNKDAYTEDEEVMIAYYRMTPEPCPINGGYQMILPEGENIQANCLGSVQRYNPRLEFSCNSNHVVADFGSDCAPIIPIQTQTTYRSPFAYLQCVGAWDEPGGEVKAVLLQMKSDEYSFWCLHYKSVTGGEGELLSIHLAFNGKCPKNVFNENWNATDVYDTFGLLAKFVPSADKRCSDANYIKQCQSGESKCSESNQCPLNCQRCNEDIVKGGQCDLSSLAGHWNLPHNRGGPEIDVENQGLKIKDFGSFTCSSTIDSAPEEGIYSFVQGDPLSTCLPFHICVKLASPSAGIVNFFMLAAKRDSTSGQILKCSRAVEFPTYAVSNQASSLVTLLNTQKLPVLPCDIPENVTFPSGIKNCQFALKQCSGSCTTLYADYDKATCGNNTFYDIEHQHICRAHLDLSFGMKGIITSSVDRQRFLCWIFNDKELYITVPGKCNPGGADLVVSHPERLTEFDPFMAISVSQRTSSKASSNPFVDVIAVIVTMLSYCLSIYLGG